MSIKNLCQSIRFSILDEIYRSGKSHIGSCFSCVEILAVLYSEILNLNKQNLKSQNRDRFILSKGHAALAYYATLYHLGYLTKEEFQSFAMRGSKFIEHPSSEINAIEFSSGSLGLGLSVGCGMALFGQRENLSFKTYVLISDGELQEGSTWESVMFASHHRLKNLTMIVDNNQMQALGKTNQICELSELKKKLQSFGFFALEVNGHNTIELKEAMECGANKPKAIIAKTSKGRGVSFMENSLKWHYRNPNDDEYHMARKELLKNL